MSYACTATKEGGGRCRHEALATDRDWFCTQHAGMRDAGQTVSMPGLADTVLLKLNLNDRWREKMLAMGVPEKGRDVEREDAKHIAHAEQHGRDAFRYREVADSGVPVFGKEGAKLVSLYKLLRELAGAYEVVDIHIKPRRDYKTQKWMSVLVVSFSHGEKAAQNSEAFQDVMEFLASSCWGFAHIWDNPPQADGKIVHTINISHRQQEVVPDLELHLAGGLYSTKPYVAPDDETDE